VPAASAVATPVAETATTPGRPLCQLTTAPLTTAPLASRATAGSPRLSPTASGAVPGVTVTEATGAGETVIALVPDFPSLVAVIVASPGVTARTSPAAETVATLRLLVDQLTCRTLADGAHGHFVAVDRHEQEVALTRPGQGPRLFESIRRDTADLRAGAGDEVIDASGVRVLEIVLVAAEVRSHTAAMKQVDERFHAARVVMQRTGTVRRMMPEGNAPAHRVLTCRRERFLEEVPVLRVLVQASTAEEVLFRRVDADELDVGRSAETVEQSRPH
jgi:hypothetical protein